MIYFVSENSGIIGLVMFFVIFTGTALFMYLSPGAKEKYDNFANIPFAEDDNDQR